MNTVCFNQNILAWSALGAAGVVSGVVAKNSMEQLNKQSGIVGPGLFVAGWLVFLFAVVSGLDGNGMFAKVQSAVAVAMIVGSVLYMKQQMAAGKDVAWYIGMLFPIGWVLLAYTVGLGGLDGIANANVTGTKSLLSFSAAAAVLLSMMWSLPWQRKHCIVDGPGMPLFVAAWAMLIGANSLA